MNYVNVFSELGFDFNVNLKLKSIEIEKHSALTEKLNKSVFFYQSPNNTNTSFYLIITFLNDSEFEEIRKYIWNKNDADLIFYYPNEVNEVEMYYAKYSPNITKKESRLDIFSTSEKDFDKIEKIKHWQFDSGVFWLNYHKFIENAKCKSIDKELVSTLKTLKEQLNEILLNFISTEIIRNEIVQALIDRTLYIKYLEDNHIINSHFYEYYFNDSTLNYKKLLESHSSKDINLLFETIHEIFNNSLFDKPTIDDNYLTYEVRSLIASSFNSELNTKQLRLFDFQFNVIPIEFISYIYEVFLTEKQKENGIYYTPKKLAQLIIDDVINKDQIGSIFDPSCGSGMFLIIGFQKLLEIAKKQGLEPIDNIEKIRFRTKLLSENIFGIEKELSAQRFTLFSLSLQIFLDINPIDIKKFIENKLKENEKINLFSEYSFFENIKNNNTLVVNEKLFENKQFTYIVGNPPFFEIPNSNEFKFENSFLNTYEVNMANNKKLLAKNIVGKSQISQCFFIKIKEWSNETTRFGFISNSSNFYNDYSVDFQRFFYSNYGIEKIYELSKVKKILFENAKESVLGIIFSNKTNDFICYNSVELGLFSEKPFELLIIQENNEILINQSDLICESKKLRDFLVGNQNDRDFVSRFKEKNDKFENHITILEGSSSKINNGLQIVGKEQIMTEFNLTINEYSGLTKKERKDFSLKFKQKYSNPVPNENFQFPLIQQNDLLKFGIRRPKMYLGDINNFQRKRNNNIYILPKILINRTGKDLNAFVSLEKIYYNFDVYSIFLNDNKYIYFYAAIINSFLINYYVDFNYRKRIDSSFPKIGHEAIKNIPIPRNLNQNLVSKISEISKNIIDGNFKYSDKETEINELIFEIYELTYWEKQRIKDYFIPKSKIVKYNPSLDIYKKTLFEIMNFYFSSPIEIEVTSTEFDLIVMRISLNPETENPKVNKTKKYILNEIFEKNPNGNFLVGQEMIYGTDCVYIIKENININWSETKAFEDGQEILTHIIPNENGSRIH